jgi:DNA-binding transcriptional LysR family regulator
VSHAIRALETELGGRLFDRRGRTIHLTAAGEVLLQHATEAFERLDEARNRIAALRGLKEGVLLPPVLKEFRRRYPGIELIIASRPSPVAIRQVVEREADLGIVTLPAPSTNLEVHELVRREDVIICAPEHPVANRRRLRVTDLRDLPLILLDRGSHTRLFTDSLLEDAGVHPKIAMELGSIEVVKKMVQLGFGVSIVPRAAVVAEIDAGQLCAIRLRGLPARRLGLIHRRDGFLSLAAQTFAELLVRRLERHK